MDENHAPQHTTRGSVGSQVSPPVNSHATSSTFSADVGGISHVGKKRQKNEDHFIIARFGRYLETVLTNIPEEQVPARADESGYGLVVADGLGGHAAGEVASRTAITLMLDLFLKTPDWILRLTDEEFIAAAIRRSKERYAEVDAVLVEMGQQESELQGMATTLTIAASVGEDAIIAHVGDSRAYLLRGGKLMQLTRDHTIVQDWIEQGVITQEQLAANNMKHVLTQALGTVAKKIQTEVQKITLKDGDRLLLCTDGLSSLVEEETIREFLNSNDNAQRICENLVDAALTAGGTDNITVVVACYQKQ